MSKKQVKVIVNCLDGEDFYASMRIIANHGSFFQLTKADMKKKCKMGTCLNVVLYFKNHDSILVTA